MAEPRPSSLLSYIVLIGLYVGLIGSLLSIVTFLTGKTKLADFNIIGNSDTINKKENIQIKDGIYEKDVPNKRKQIKIQEDTIKAKMGFFRSGKSIQLSDNYTITYTDSGELFLIKKTTHWFSSQTNDTAFSVLIGNIKTIYFYRANHYIEMSFRDGSTHTDISLDKQFNLIQFAYFINKINKLGYDINVISRFSNVLPIAAMITLILSLLSVYYFSKLKKKHGLGCGILLVGYILTLTLLLSIHGDGIVYN